MTFSNENFQSPKKSPKKNSTMPRKISLKITKTLLSNQNASQLIFVLRSGFVKCGLSDCEPFRPFIPLKAKYIAIYSKPSKLTLDNHKNLFQTIDYMQSLDFESFERLRKNIWSQAYVQGHIEGNFTVEEAKSMFNCVLEKLSCQGKRVLIQSQSVKKVKEPVALKFENFNKTDGNRYFIILRRFFDKVLQLCNFALSVWGGDSGAACADRFDELSNFGAGV